MGDVDQRTGLALAIIPLGLGLIGYYIDIPEVVRSYRHAELRLWATTTKLHDAKISLNTQIRGFNAAQPSATTPTEGSTRLMQAVDTSKELCAHIERELATILPTPSDSTNNELQIRRYNIDTLDLEAQLPPMPRFASHAAKLNWVLRDRSRALETKVDVFCEQVEILTKHSSCTLNRTLFSPVPSLSTPDESTIWLTDFRGTVRRFNVELCRGVGNFVLCLLLALTSSEESLDSHTLTALLNGEFWVMAEDQHDYALESTSSRCLVRPRDDRRHGAILADTWEQNVRPGRRFRVIMPTGDTGQSPSAQPDSFGPSLDKKTLHEPWEGVVRPFLPNILQLLGLDERYFPE